jgi:16S rRNA processing protein RimM
MTGHPQLVVVGRVLATHGASGQIRVQVHSDVPHRFDSGKVLYLDEQPNRITYSAPFRSDQVILRFQGIDTVTAARSLVGQWLTAPESPAQLLPEGDYFHYQIIGLGTITEDGEELGQVREIISTGSNDVYLVSDGSTEILIPAIAEVIQEINLEEGVMVVRLMEGLR